MNFAYFSCMRNTTKAIFAWTFGIGIVLGSASTNGTFAQLNENAAYTTPTSFDVIYSQKIYDRQLLTFDGVSNNLKVLNSIGIGFSGGFERDDDYNFMGHFDYLQILPTPVNFPGGETGMITGFNLSNTVFGFDVFDNRFLDFILEVGYSVGRLRIYDNDFYRRKNPYFMPAGSAAVKLNIWKFSAQFRLGYEYDISKKYWKRTNKGKNTIQYSIPDTFQTGFQANVALGFLIGND